MDLEWSYKRDLAKLELKQGDIFHGEAMLAIAKAMLQSGISYVGGYQGAPVAYLMDIFAEAGETLDKLGIHFETNANEAAAAAMLGASVHYPMRGAAIWKSVAGTAVASDALANLSTTGVKGGVVVIVGADFGEGANVGQERTNATAMKSQIWLIEPRPHLPTIVNLVEKGFDLSEASNTPVMLELRLRACHVYGRFTAKNNKTPTISRRKGIDEPARFDANKLVLPPVTFAQERHKVEKRLPAAIEFIRRHRLNEVFPGSASDVGIVLQGVHYNAVVAGLRELGLADVFGQSSIPILCLNVTYPIVPDEIVDFCVGKRAVLIVEDGYPDYVQQAVEVVLRRADLQTDVIGKSVLPATGEYTPQIILDGLAKFIEGSLPAGIDIAAVGRQAAALKPDGGGIAALGRVVPARPPGFCTGCPERPVFSALKMLESETGRVHLAADIGCHAYATLPPFNMGHTILGYGLGLAAASGVSPFMDRPIVSSMGDGGFWHNGLTTSVANAVFNKDDALLVIYDNGYTSSTGRQRVPSTGRNFRDEPTGMTIANVLRGIGVQWMQTVRTYDMPKVIATLRAAFAAGEKGLRVIIAQSECMLAKQAREAPLRHARLAAGDRIVRTRFGIDDEVCTGDHACIRLSGCPSLTLKSNPDPLKDDPVAHVNENCVGCGLCGANAHAAILCPSFYRAEIVHNPTAFDRVLDRLRNRILDWLRTRDRSPIATPAGAE